jgi:hypothetical protein
VKIIRLKGNPKSLPCDWRDELQAQGLFEAVRYDEHGVAENFAARAIGDNPSSVQEDGPRAKLEYQFEVMRSDELCGRQPVNELDQATAAPRVEVGRGFIEYEYRWFAGQHAGQTDAFTLAKAQVMWRAIGKISQVDAFQTIECDPPRLDGRFTHVQRSERDILDHRVAKELVVRILENQSNAPADFGRVSIVDFQTVDPDTRSKTSRGVSETVSAGVIMAERHPAPCRQQTVQVQEERALACPVGPNQGNCFTGANVELDAAKCLFAVGIAVFETAYPDRRHRLIAVRSCHR